MESPQYAPRKTHHCRSCGLPMKGHQRGACGSPGGTPETERSTSMTPQTAAGPKPLMPGRFNDQRPSEVFVDTPLIDRIGPKVEEEDYAKIFHNDDRVNLEEPERGLGLGYGIPPSLAVRNGPGNGPGSSRQRLASTPLRQLPTVLNNSVDTILPEHSVSNARIRSFRPDTEADYAWCDSTPALSADGSASLISYDLHAVQSPSPPRNHFRATSEDNSDAQSLTWSEALRETSAKPLAMFYTIPMRFGTYLQRKIHRGGAGGAVFPLDDDPDPAKQQAILATGEFNFIQQIRPHRNEMQQEFRQRTPARSRRSTPIPAASPIARAVTPSHLDQTEPIIPASAQKGESKLLRGVIFISFGFGVLIGICLTFYFLLRFEATDFEDASP